MKKNPKPLTYLVHPSLMETAEIKELIRKGHTVTQHDALTGGDLVIGPNCYRISEATVNLLELATRAERAVKYPKKKGEASDES